MRDEGGNDESEEMKAWLFILNSFFFIPHPSALIPSFIPSNIGRLLCRLSYATVGTLCRQVRAGSPGL
jgi:hypothetical protein